MKPINKYLVNRKLVKSDINDSDPIYSHMKTFVSVQDIEEGDYVCVTWGKHRAYGVIYKINNDKCYTTCLVSSADDVKSGGQLGLVDTELKSCTSEQIILLNEIQEYMKKHHIKVKDNDWFGHKLGSIVDDKFVPGV